MLNITRATTHILRVHYNVIGQNVEGTIFVGTWGHGPTKILTAKHFESAE